MPCIPLPSLPFPNLPAGITLSPSLPAVNENVTENLCCLLPVSIGISIKPPLPPLAITGLAAALETLFTLAEEYIALLPLKCPRG